MSNTGTDVLEPVAVSWWQKKAKEYPDGRIPKDTISVLAKEQAHHAAIPVTQALTYAAKAGLVTADDVPTPILPTVPVVNTLQDTGQQPRSPSPQLQDQADPASDSVNEANQQSGDEPVTEPQGGGELAKPDADLSNQELLEKYWWQAGEGKPKLLAELISKNARPMNATAVSAAKSYLKAKDWKPPKAPSAGPTAPPVVAAPAPEERAPVSRGRKPVVFTSEIDGLISKLETAVKLAEARLEEVRADLEATRRVKDLEGKY